MKYGLLKIGGGIGVVNIATLGVSFLSSIILVRMLGTEMYGKYIYIVAIAAMLPIWYSALDSILIRFGPLKNVAIKIIYLKSIIAVKLLIFLVLVFALSYYIYLFEEEVVRNDSLILIVVLLIAKEFISIFKASFAAVVNIYEKYYFLALVSFINALAYLMFVSGASIICADDENFLVYIVSYTLIAATITLIVSRTAANKLLGVEYGVFDIRIKDFSNLYSEGKIKYFGPLQLVSIQSYIKLYLPQILLGDLSTFNNVAYYEIARKIYKIVHSFIPKILNLFMPTIIKEKDDNFLNFVKQFKKYSIAYVLMIFFISSVLLYMNAHISKLYIIENVETWSLLFFVFSVDLVLAAIGNLHNIIIRIGDNTVGILNASILRTFIGGIIMYYLIQDYGIEGAGYGKMVDTFILTSMLILYSYKYINIIKYVSPIFICSVLLLWEIYEA